MDSGLLEDILKWKREYRNIFLLKINENIYIYRSLSKSEYSSLLAVSSIEKDLDTEDIIFSECLLFPKYKKGMFDNYLAGEVESVLAAITSVIGFSATDQFVDDVDLSRSKLGSLENQIVILICKAFPHLTLSDIDNFTYEELLRYMVISEEILGMKITIEKPSSKKAGVIDFEKENREMNQPPPQQFHQRPKRGDVSR